MIQGNNSIELCDAAMLDALSRYLSEEFKSPVKATKFVHRNVSYDSTTSVTFVSATEEAKEERT